MIIVIYLIIILIVGIWCYKLGKSKYYDAYDPLTYLDLLIYMIVTLLLPFNVLMVILIVVSSVCDLLDRPIK